jgi:class 3 adenylate cyclase/tetratricopeptide (TPR) repeat protein
VPQERKLATVLFADIVDSSGATNAVEPEVLRGTLSEAFSGMRRVLTAHGGTVEKFIGDAVMAVFGVPVAHDDDAERAVRAALAMREAIAAMRRRPALVLRIGINSGEVVSGDDEHAESLVTGLPVIVAARLEQAAAHGEILVGDLTRRLTMGRFRYGPARTIVGKGVGEIEAAAVETIVESPSGRIGSGRASFIGRESELSVLQEIYAEVGSTGGARRVLISGVAGIGKSRLTDEFIQQLGPAGLFRAHCPPYGQGITLSPLREIVREAAGIAPTDSSQEAREKLESTVESIRAPREGGSLLGWLMALAVAEPGMSDLAPEKVHTELASALARYLEGISRSVVTTLVFEDLHWAEPALLEILDELTARIRAPALILALARPEFLERHPTWAGAPPDVRIELEPLTREETKQLAGELLRERSVEGDVLSAVALRAEGNPLYVEELARVVIDHGDPQAVPPTLHGVIASRLDRVDPRVKRLLQRASVLGRDFWLDAVPWEEDAALLPRDAAEAVRRDLIGAREDLGPSGTSTYRFRHALIRDVAYGSTAKAERSRLHDHYARWLSAVAGERGREYVEIVAYHAEEAFRLAREMEVADTGELGRRAFEALVASAAAARDRADARASLTLSERALEIADAASIGAGTRTRPLAYAAIARLRLEPSPEAHVLLDRAIELARAEGPSEHLIRMLVWRAQVALVGDVGVARALFAEAVDAARALRDDELIVYALWGSGQPLETTGALAEQIQILTEARDHMVRTGSDRWLVDTLSDMSASTLEMGDTRAAVAHAEDAAVLAEDRGTRLQRFKASLAVARASLASNEIGRALRVARSAFELGRELGGPWALAESARTLAEAHRAAGDLGSARRVLEECSARLDPATMPAMRGRIARVRALLSEIYLALDEPDLARHAAEAARSAAPTADTRALALGTAALARVEMSAGNEHEAKRLFDEALHVVEPTDYRVLTARLRAEYARLGVQIV